MTEPRPESPGEPAPERLGFGRRARRLALRLALVFLFLEVALRGGVYLVKGQNPYYLFYGFQGVVSQAHVSPWSVYDGQYFKFPPGYELQGAAGQKGETAHINALGFRGPDFEPGKAPGTFRVICMGGSSTFGFHNDDDETYPHYLQQLFDEQPAARPVEVLNAGFPYYNSATIRGLLRDELLDYGPDLVTLYCGYNDASWPLRTSTASRVVSWLQQRSITCYVFNETILTDKRFYSLVSKLEGLLPGDGGTDAARFEEEVERVAARMIDNVRAVARLASERGAGLLLIRQPVSVRHQDRSLAQLTYEEEVASVRAKLEAGERLTEFERRLLCHRRLVDELDRLAAANDWPVVDNIALVDADRSRLSSWVHLTPGGNRALAAELRVAIEERMAPTWD